MKNILTLIFALICINTFAQTDYDWFWSYRKSTGQDTIFYTTANLYADGKIQTRSGSSVILNGFRSIPVNTTTRVSYSDYSIGGGLYLNYLTSKKNNITQLTNFYGRGTVFSLDISKAKALTTLGVTTCRLSSLDLSKNKMLESVSIGNEAATYTSINLNENNLLRTVSIYNHSDADGYGYALNTIYLENNPILEFINCSYNYFLNQIHLGLPNYNLSYFYGFESAFTQTSVDYILKWLVDGNRYGGTVNLCGQRNAIPSTLGMTYVYELTNRGWNVCVNRSYANPTVQSNPATSIFINYATLNGSVINEGSSSVNERGFYYSTTPDPKNSGTKITSGSGAGQFSYVVTGLSANTKYYFCAYALSNDGYGYGDDLDFTTPVQEQTVPELITTLPSNIGTISATSGGTITFDGNYPITAKGVQWSLDSNFSTIAGSTNDGTGVSSFTSSVTGLQSNTAYYVRSFATNRKDVGGFYVYATGYGQTEMFMTASSSSCILPTVSTNGINNITEMSAIGGGNVTLDGGCDVKAKGLCLSTAMNPTTSDSHTTDGSGIGAFSSSITGLTCGNTYYVRAYATNSSGTAYGNQVSFMTTSSAIATITGFSSVTSTSFTANCSVTSSCSNITSRGIIYSTSSGVTYPTNAQACGSGTGTYDCTPYATLSPSTTYYVKSYVIVNGSAIYLSLESTVTTLAIPPVDPCTLSVGDSYGGGIVAYVFQSGDPGYISGQCHGIIAATSDQSTGAYFGCYGSNLTGSSSILLKSGEQNTIDIIAGCSDSGTSARLCYDYSSGSYSDWWLPSLNELLKLYANRSLIGGFNTSAVYSSSSEVDAYSVYSVNFVDGSYSVGSNTKLYPFYVRAIRYF